MASFNDYIASNFPTADIVQDGYDGTQSRGEQISKTESGAIRIRRLYSASYFDLTVSVAGLLAADVATIRAKYDSADDIDSLTDPLSGNAYSVTWTEPPRITDIDGDFYMMEFKFYGKIA